MSQKIAGVPGCGSVGMAFIRLTAARGFVASQGVRGMCAGSGRWALPKNEANFTQLSPMSFLKRIERVQVRTLQRAEWASAIMDLKPFPSEAN